MSLKANFIRAICPLHGAVFLKGSLVKSNCTLLDESRYPSMLAHLIRAIALYSILAVVPNACTLDRAIVTYMMRSVVPKG